jgi:hypothetical protein
MNVWRKADEKNDISSNCFMLFGVLYLPTGIFYVLIINWYQYIVISIVKFQNFNFLIFFLKKLLSFFASPEKFGKTNLRRSYKSPSIYNIFLFEMFWVMSKKANVKFFLTYHYYSDIYFSFTKSQFTRFASLANELKIFVN